MDYETLIKCFAEQDCVWLWIIKRIFKIDIVCSSVSRAVLTLLKEIYVPLALNNTSKAH